MLNKYIRCALLIICLSTSRTIVYNCPTLYFLTYFSKRSTSLQVHNQAFLINLWLTTQNALQKGPGTYHHKLESGQVHLPHIFHFIFNFSTKKDVRDLGTSLRRKNLRCSFHVSIGIYERVQSECTKSCAVTQVPLERQGLL